MFTGLAPVDRNDPVLLGGGKWSVDGQNSGTTEARDQSFRCDVTRERALAAVLSVNLFVRTGLLVPRLQHTQGLTVEAVVREMTGE